MTERTLQLTNDLTSYLYEMSFREPDVLRRLREETAELEESSMQIGPVQGQLLALLVELVGARRTLEVGTFRGYSALWVALALPDDGTLVACDVNEEWTSAARHYWEEAGVAHKIDLRLAPAAETLDALLGQGAAETFDFAFIDADKACYDVYYEAALRLVRPGGVIAVDNTLWSGKVCDPEVRDRDTEAIRAFNRKVKSDWRVTASLLPLGDGVTLARRR